MKPKRIRHLGSHLRQLNQTGRDLAPSVFWRNYAIAVTVCCLAFAYCARQEARYRAQRAKTMQDSGDAPKTHLRANTGVSDGVQAIYRTTTDAGIEVTETPDGIKFEF